MKTWTPEDIKTLRRRLKLSQVSFGKRLGVSGNYVYLLEKGVRTASTTLKLLLNCVEEKEKRERR